MGLKLEREDETRKMQNNQALYVAAGPLPIDGSNLSLMNVETNLLSKSVSCKQRPDLNLNSYPEASRTCPRQRLYARARARRNRLNQRSRTSFAT